MLNQTSLSSLIDDFVTTHHHSRAPLPPHALELDIRNMAVRIKTRKRKLSLNRLRTRQMKREKKEERERTVFSSISISLFCRFGKRLTPTPATDISRLFAAAECCLFFSSWPLLSIFLKLTLSCQKPSAKWPRQKLPDLLAAHAS